MVYYVISGGPGGQQTHGTAFADPVIIQNQPPKEVDHAIQLGDAWYYQQFKLPTDYMRGGTTIPPISGIQVKTKVPKHLIKQVTIDYTLDVREGSRWTTLASGTSLGSSMYGDEVWLTINFDSVATVTPLMLNETFRFGVKGRQTAPPHKSHKCLPIRRWNNQWYYYNHTPYYGNDDFGTYGYNDFYRNYPYYEWGYNGFPYYYNYPWWGNPYGPVSPDVLGVINQQMLDAQYARYGQAAYFFPWTNPYGWNWLYGNYNTNFYSNFYNYYYGYPYSPYSIYDHLYQNYYPLTDQERWWNHWDDWGWENDTFPLLAFDEGVIPSDLIDLEEEVPYLIDNFDGSPSYLYRHKESEQDEQWGFHHKYCLNTQEGINWLWYSSPNPYVRVQDSYVTDSNSNIILQDGSSISFMFRLLSLVADSGLDEFGMPYRNSVIIHEAKNLDTNSNQANALSWISKPNPSKFAIENLFVDISDADNLPQVVDRVYMDPQTTGVYFSIYYSNEGVPGATINDWENKLWTRVPKTYKLTKADSYALPVPITAKYINIEFSTLQARPYISPDLAQPVRYKKHPKWVLDYFLARTSALESVGSLFVANSVTVTYNAYDIAYNYYMDDINQTPTPPNPLIAPLNARVTGSLAPSVAQASTINNFFSNRSDLSDKIDQGMVGQISTLLNPYLSTPIVKSDLSFLVGQYANFDSSKTTTNYPVEADPNFLLPQINSNVSSLNRDQLVFEQGMPIMYFYIQSRHVYREVSANFDSGVSYQVGLNALAFQREHYTVKYDSPFYLESGGDNANVEQNDFVRVDNAWATYAKAKT